MTPPSAPDKFKFDKQAYTIDGQKVSHFHQVEAIRAVLNQLEEDECSCQPQYAQIYLHKSGWDVAGAVEGIKEEILRRERKLEVYDCRVSLEREKILLPLYPPPNSKHALTHEETLSFIESSDQQILEFEGSGFSWSSSLGIAITKSTTLAKERALRYDIEKEEALYRSKRVGVYQRLLNHFPVTEEGREYFQLCMDIYDGLYRGWEVGGVECKAPGAAGRGGKLRKLGYPVVLPETEVNAVKEGIVVAGLSPKKKKKKSRGKKKKKVALEVEGELDETEDVSDWGSEEGPNYTPSGYSILTEEEQNVKSFMIGQLLEKAIDRTTRAQQSFGLQLTIDRDAIGHSARGSQQWSRTRPFLAPYQEKLPLCIEQQLFDIKHRRKKANPTLWGPQHEACGKACTNLSVSQWRDWTQMRFRNSSYAKDLDMKNYDEYGRRWRCFRKEIEAQLDNPISKHMIVLEIMAMGKDAKKDADKSVGKEVGEDPALVSGWDEINVEMGKHGANVEVAGKSLVGKKATVEDHPDDEEDKIAVTDPLFTKAMEPTSEYRDWLSGALADAPLSRKNFESTLEEISAHWGDAISSNLENLKDDLGAIETSLSNALSEKDMLEISSNMHHMMTPGQGTKKFDIKEFKAFMIDSFAENQNPASSFDSAESFSLYLDELMSDPVQSSAIISKVQGVSAALPQLAMMTHHAIFKGTC